jgi:hypothetical protein
MLGCTDVDISASLAFVGRAGLRTRGTLHASGTHLSDALVK